MYVPSVVTLLVPGALEGSSAAAGLGSVWDWARSVEADVTPPDWDSVSSSASDIAGTTTPIHYDNYCTETRTYENTIATVISCVRSRKCTR